MPKASSRPHGVVSNLSLNLLDQGSGRYQHIKKIRNENEKKKKKEKARTKQNERDTKRKKKNEEIEEKNKEKGNRLGERRKPEQTSNEKQKR